MSNKEIAAAVGHIPSGLFIVCAQSEDGQKDGYLASWVQQVSFNPLLVALAVNPDRPGYETIKSGRAFTVNVVGEQETSFLRHFWKGYAPGQGPFGEINHEVSENGGILIKDALSTIECTFKESIKPGDHEIVIAEVIQSYVHHDSKSKVHLRKNGLDY
ncbi:MAG: flavin reductase family protein [Bacteriovoracaceae bacterium]